MLRIITHLARAAAITAVAVAAALWALAPAATARTLQDGSYTTDISTSAPTGLTPAHGSTAAWPAPLSLGWRAIAGASSYQLQIALQSSSSVTCTAANAFQTDNLVVSTTTSQTTWLPSLSGAANGEDVWLGTYCWRVRTVGSPSGSWTSGSRFTRTWSGVPTSLRFYNDHDGPVPRSSSSSDYATGSTITRNAGYFDWNGVAGAATYDIEVATSQSFAKHSVMVRREGIVGTRMSSLHLPDDTYYWRVRAVAANGTEGGWTTASNAFTVAWDDPNWSAPAKLYPTDTGVSDEMVIGWTPVPGAAYYEYQVATNAGCFWNSVSPDLAPAAWGDWVNESVIVDDADPPNLVYATPAQSGHCRLSDDDPAKARTINNWVTATDIYADEVKSNLSKDCFNEEATQPVECIPAGVPVSTGIDISAVYNGTAMAPGEEDQPGVSIHWRVRPVFHITGNTETGWEVSDDGIKIYGSWTKYTSGGANRPYRFDLDPSSGATSSVGSRCESTFNSPLYRCLEHDGESMQADEAVGAATSTTLQVPLLRWNQFPGAGCYVVQYALDPLFNNTVRVVVLNNEQHSYAPTGGMIDNSEDTGYWWRVLPGGWTWFPSSSEWRCLPKYNEDSGGLETDGYTDDGVAQTYQKITAMQTKISTSFNGAAPLIQWAAADVASNDWDGWSAGVEGASYYELEYARDPFMTDDVHSLMTTVPRAVPFEPSTEGEGKQSELGDGIWYYRVRAIDLGDDAGTDEDDLPGSWSTVKYFNKRIAGPDTNTSGGGAAAGATISWDAVEGATHYTVQWSTSSLMTSPTTATTKQTSYRIPPTKTGTFYWRVRASIGDVNGLWSTVTSAGPKVTIVPATRIRFALNKQLINARDYAMLDAQLLIAGHARNGKTVQLQAKSRGCDSSQGTYSQIGQAVTGRNVDDGMVRFRLKALSNACLRLAWVGSGGTHYSAPIKVRTQPVLGFRLSRKEVLRGRGFCSIVTSNVPLYGRVQVQYKVRNSWVTARTGSVAGKTRWRQCAAINRAGTFPIRVRLDRMNHPTQYWRMYEPTARTSGTIRVNDVWTVS